MARGVLKAGESPWAEGDLSLPDEKPGSLPSLSSIPNLS